MGQIVFKISLLDSCLHSQYSWIDLFDNFPTHGFYKSKRPQTIRKWHLSQTGTKLCLVAFEHYRIHLGTSVFKRFMYIFSLKIVNFIISGSATQWYLQQSENGLCFTFTRMIKYHFGSVVGGSFLNAFFNIIDFVFESLRCYPDGRCNKFAPCCNIIFDTFLGFLCNLVRTDVYSYVNMAGIPYCNACRNCE